MKQYMITVMASAVLSALAQLVSPEKWAKYIRIICGIMIISVIAAPIGELRKIDIFGDYPAEEQLDMNAQKKAVIEEMQSRISGDVEKRVSDEFSENIKAEVKLKINDSYEIEGVDEINIWEAVKREKIRQRLFQVYAPEKILFHN